MQEIAGRLPFREGVPKLLGDPRSRRIAGDGHMDDPSTVVLEDDQHEQQSERNCRHDEQVGGHHLARVIGQEGPPCL